MTENLCMFKKFTCLLDGQERRKDTVAVASTLAIFGLTRFKNPYVRESYVSVKTTKTRFRNGFKQGIHEA